MTLRSSLRKTEEKVLALERYLTTNVLSTEFVCRHYRECKSSHCEKFYEGQLHHVGRYYDLLSDDLPFRIVVVGQEYGMPPARASSEVRYAMVMKSAFGSRFTAGGGEEARNPHMRGTTSVLRLLFGIPLGVDYESEFLTINSERRHLFDAFALVNYLLCSAVPDDETKRGKATPTMKRNCREHFREALRILEPSVVIVQGKSFWMSCVKDAFDLVWHEAHDVYTARLGTMQTLVAAFTHPSAPLWKDNWGTNDRTPYLVNTVKPSISWVRQQILGVL